MYFYYSFLKQNYFGLLQLEKYSKNGLKYLSLSLSLYLDHPNQIEQFHSKNLKVLKSGAAQITCMGVYGVNQSA